MPASRSLSYDVYSSESFVNQYRENIKGNIWNAFYERPASRSLLPNLQNKFVLDAGCGPGLNTKEFIEAGAIVSAVDYSELMVKSAEELTEGKARIFVADLNNGLPQFKDEEFDVIYASLVIHYVDDLATLFKEFRRILRKGGVLVFSTDHPQCSEYLAENVDHQMKKTYFWSNIKVYMDVYLRPWSINEEALTRNNFEIDQVLEPIPLEESKSLYPEQYEYLSNNKHFICVRAIAK